MMRYVNVLVDPAHSSVNPGRITADGTTEAGLNLAVAMRLRDLLSDFHGLSVKLTREDGDGPSSRQRIEMMSKATWGIQIQHGGRAPVEVVVPMKGKLRRELGRGIANGLGQTLGMKVQLRRLDPGEASRHQLFREAAHAIRVYAGPVEPVPGNDTLWLEAEGIYRGVSTFLGL
jgi:hypothetical protein